MFANIVWPSKPANAPPFYVFLIQRINVNCIFSNLLANVPSQPLSWQTYPSSHLGGLGNLASFGESHLAQMAATSAQWPNRSSIGRWPQSGKWTTKWGSLTTKVQNRLFQSLGSLLAYQHICLYGIVCMCGMVWYGIHKRLKVGFYHI